MGDILFLAHRVPFPPNRGDKIRAHFLLKKLASMGPVHVGCFAENAEDRAATGDLKGIAASHCIVQRSKPLVLAGVEALVSRKPVSLTAFFSDKLRQWVNTTIAERAIDTIVIFSGQMGQYVPTDFAGRVVIDLCDVDSAKFEGYAAAGQRAWLNAREGRLLARCEEKLARRADATVLISRHEADLFTSRLQFPSMAHVEVIGNGIDAQFFDPSKVAPHAQVVERAGPHFVFTGQMDYPPNEAAALWTIEEFLPRIRQEHPSAEFHIVGRNPTRTLRSHSDRPGVTIWGEVPDVRPFLAAADCVIAPLQIARGVQNKVLEAMAMASPVLLTPEAATGIDALDGEHWLMCEANTDQMCARYCEFAASGNAGSLIGKKARDFVLAHHDWDAMLEPLEALVRGDDGGVRNAA